VRNKQIRWVYSVTSSHCILQSAPGHPQTEKMLLFLGLTTLIGLVYKLRLHMYWSNDEIYCTPLFGQVMSRDWFLLNLHFLDFSDNDLCGINDPQCDRLHKIRPFLDMLKANCASVFSPGRDLCVQVWCCSRAKLPSNSTSEQKEPGSDWSYSNILCTSSGIQLLDFLAYKGEDVWWAWISQIFFLGESDGDSDEPLSG